MHFWIIMQQEWKVNLEFVTTRSIIITGVITRPTGGDKSMITLTVAGIFAVNAVAFLVSRSSIQDIDNDYWVFLFFQECFHPPAAPSGGSGILLRAVSYLLTVANVAFASFGLSVYMPPLNGSTASQPIKPPNTKLPPMYQPLAVALTGKETGWKPSFV